MILGHGYNLFSVAIKCLFYIHGHAYMCLQFINLMPIQLQYSIAHVLLSILHIMLHIIDRSRQHMGEIRLFADALQRSARWCNFQVHYAFVSCMSISYALISYRLRVNFKMRLFLSYISLCQFRMLLTKSYICFQGGKS